MVSFETRTLTLPDRIVAQSTNRCMTVHTASTFRWYSLVCVPVRFSNVFLKSLNSPITYSCSAKGAWRTSALRLKKLNFSARTRNYALSAACSENWFDINMQYTLHAVGTSTIAELSFLVLYCVLIGLFRALSVPCAYRKIFCFLSANSDDIHPAQIAFVE